MKEKVRHWLIILTIGGGLISIGSVLLLLLNRPSINEDITPLFFLLVGASTIVGWPVVKGIWLPDLPDDV